MDHDEFMAFVSHELRTPLSVIALNLDILDRNYKSELSHPEVAEHLTMIRHATSEMVPLMEKLSQRSNEL